MKQIHIVFLLLAGTMSLASCFGDEPANAECDIERAWVHVDDPSSVFYHQADTLADILPSYASNNIQFPLMRYDAVVTWVPLFLQVTPGAQVFQVVGGRETAFASGTVVDFSDDKEQTFRVRSEDGKYMREYTIRMKHDKEPSLSAERIELGSLTIGPLNTSSSEGITTFTYDQRMDIMPYGEVPVSLNGTKEGERCRFTLNIMLSSDHSLEVAYDGQEYRGTYDGSTIVPKQAGVSISNDDNGALMLTLDSLDFDCATLVHFNFEDVQLDEKSHTFDVWTETDPLCEPDFWATGNPGYQLSVSSAKRDGYPTVSVDGGVDGGKCVQLTTRDTGGFGKMVNMRIAAGNLFAGTFDVGNALKDALAATRMGTPFGHKPLYMSGYYKYKPGPTKQDKMGNPIPNEEDMCDFYCVFYKNSDEHGQSIQLDGSNVLSSPYIVAKARIKHEDIDKSGEEWIYFELPLEYTEELNRDDVQRRQYSVGIGFSSSIDGASFSGAVGSTLWIDNITLLCEY